MFTELMTKFRQSLDGITWSSFSSVWIEAGVRHVNSPVWSSWGSGFQWFVILPMLALQALESPMIPHTLQSFERPRTTTGTSDQHMTELLVATFYKFTILNDHAALQPKIEAFCRDLDVRGIILLAEEGINATISGTRESVIEAIEFLKKDPRLSDLTWKESPARNQPFRKLRVRLKKEIVTMGVEGIDPAQLAGTYVSAEDWNDLISDPDVMVIDTRNDYEVEIGTFQGSVDPEISTFGELPEWIKRNISIEEQPKVAMFCTGGIRCEKSTALLKQAGVREVYHLEGGILKYLEKVPENESLWEGQCFVFDERVSVGHGLEVGDYELCRACRDPLSKNEKTSPHYRRGVSCSRCFDRTTEDQKERFAERQRQLDLAETRRKAGMDTEH